MSPKLREIHQITSKQEALGLEGKEKSRFGRVFLVGLAEAESTGFAWASAGSDPPLLALRGVLTGDRMSPGHLGLQVPATPLTRASG